MGTGKVRKKAATKYFFYGVFVRVLRRYIGIYIQHCPARNLLLGGAPYPDLVSFIYITAFPAVGIVSLRPPPVHVSTFYYRVTYVNSDALNLIWTMSRGEMFIYFMYIRADPSISFLAALNNPRALRYFLRSARALFTHSTELFHFPAGPKP